MTTRPCARAYGSRVCSADAIHEAVRELVARHSRAERLLGRLPLIKRAVAEADLGDETVVPEVAQSADGPVHWCRPSGMMNLVEVDRRRAQPPRTRRGVQPHRRRDRARRVELGRHERRVPVRDQRVAEDALAVPEAADPRRVDDGGAPHEGPAREGSRLDPVDLRGVIERHAELDSPPDDRVGVESRVVPLR